MCSSSRVPAFGLIGTIGTPGGQRAHDRDAGLERWTRPHRHPRRTRHPRGHRTRRGAQLRVTQRILTDPHGLATGVLLQTCSRARPKFYPVHIRRDLPITQG